MLDKLGQWAHDYFDVIIALMVLVVAVLFAIMANVGL